MPAAALPPAWETIVAVPRRPPDPDCKLDKARSGALVARRRGVFLDSRYDPEREAERRAAALQLEGKQVVVLLGDGLYYLARRLSRNPKIQIIVLEADPCLAQAALAGLGKEALQDFSLVFCESLQTSADMQHILPPDLGAESVLFVEHAPSVQHFPEEYARVRRLLTGFVRRRVADLETGSWFGRRWLFNIVDNLAHIPHAFSLTAVEHHSDILILGPGPSLDGFLERRRGRQPGGLLLALAPALRPLLEHDLRPHLVCASDGGFPNLLHVAGLACPGIPLLMPLLAHSGLARHWEGQRILCSYGLPVERLLLEEQALSLVPETPTVALFALHVAHALGAQRVFTAGLDFAALGCRAHCRGYRFDEDRSFRTIRTATAEAVACRPLTGSERRGPYRADPRLRLYGQAFAESVAALGVHWITLDESPFAEGAVRDRSLPEQRSQLSLVGRAPQNGPLARERLKRLLPLLRQARHQVENAPDTDSMEALCSEALLLPIWEMLRPLALHQRQRGRMQPAREAFFSALAPDLLRLEKKLQKLLNSAPRSADI